MVCELRRREGKQISETIYSCSENGTSSSDETSSRSDDPDYKYRPPPRKLPKHIVKQDLADQMANPGNSTQVRRKRGRPSKHNVETQRNSRRRKTLPPLLNDSAAPWFMDMGEKTILSWLIEHGKIVNAQFVCYVDQSGNAVLTGSIARAGILCQCCKRVITVWDFESHAGGIFLKRPYEHIMLMGSTKKSLLQCQIEAGQENQYGFNEIMPKTSEDSNDDACMICWDGGELICCERCPSTFHLSCMNMELQRVPAGEWRCPNCVCKFCGFAGYDEKFLLTCSSCEKKYHSICSIGNRFEQDNRLDLNINSASSFCSERCQEISVEMEKMARRKNDLDSRYTWTLLQQGDIISSNEPAEDLHEKVQSNSKISVAWGMMNECFKTIIDRHTGLNVLESVIYSQGSNLSRVNFKGFYTAVLEKDDDVISTATIRIHGTRMAEMPFVATRENYRRQGLLHKLLGEIESALRSLRVEYLVIAAAREVIGMWINKFHFCPVEIGMIKNEILSSNTLMFPGAVRLQKRLL